jgi:hydroxymethylpyrimidine pyrophosphatase-like HAD family hydrolase
MMSNYLTETVTIKEEATPMTKSRAIICDLDGTLAINDGKRSFYNDMKCYGDSVDPTVLYIVKIFRNGGYRLLFTSGRKEKSRYECMRWLRDKCSIAPDDYVLLMRKDEDNRSDKIVKEEMYVNDIEHKYEVEVCFDDRDCAVEAWRGLGLKCFQVAPGDF